ncbi:MAG TPA: DoxX family protein [Parachlamydiaceae bacterium]|nr:DoxX family protein [Parachlamydiaceae bacterium]
MKFCCSILLFLGRLAISAIFLLAGIGKFLDYEGTSQYMLSKGLPFVPVFLVIAALVEILAALALIVGFKTRWAAFLLFLFLIPTTYIFHDFWNLGEPESALQFIMFMKNLAIGGGLLYIMGAGPGSLAADRYCSSSDCCSSGYCSSEEA